MSKTQLFFVSILFIVTACHQDKARVADKIDYSISENWACYSDNSDHSVDLFFVAPTVFMGDSNNWNMQLSDAETKEKFVGAINMEKGLYDTETNFYAPFYRQMGLSAYNERGYTVSISDPSIQEAFNKAYLDVEDAFEYYLSISDKPFILAGFSQGSELLIELVKNKLSSKELQDRHIATYAIGWRVSNKEVNQHPHLKMAQNEDDLGVVISFNSEAAFVDSSIIVPAGEKSLSINPLNWSTDTANVMKDKNLGACFTNYDGEIISEINSFTGAYLCPKRGTLKAVDVNPDDYIVHLEITPRGVYHLYDYQFFYRNIQENVQKRRGEYFDKNH